MGNMSGYEAIKSVLDEAFSSYGRLRGLVLADQEGLPVAVQGDAREEAQESLSAALSLAVKACKTAAETFKVGRVRRGIMDAEEGVVVIGEVEPGYYLALVSEPGSMPGEMLMLFRELRGKLSKALRILETY